MFRTGSAAGKSKSDGTADPKAAQYAAKKRREAARNAAASKSGRDIGPVPDIADVKRRTRCRNSLRYFCETYNPEAFSLKWSPDHIRVIERIEEAAMLGALYAFAMPRGSGKSTVCRMGALWSLAYAHCRYTYLIGATGEKAEDSLDAIKMYCRFLPVFGADFPEMCHGPRALAGLANRANGQISKGEPTLITWSKDRVVFPTVKPPSNWPAKWELLASGTVPTSGSVLSVSGLTGEGIRGSLLTLQSGESIRPDLVLIDDPQSRESATSPTQNRTREILVSADVLGMAGPGKKISAVMPCTVIEKGDMADCLLDRTKHPLWRGERTQMLESFPADTAAWEEYFEVYLHCAQLEPPDFKAANSLYRKDRRRLDAGATASWPQRKLPGEVSAIQSAMHLYVRDRRAFMSEYQNDPEDQKSYSALLDLNAEAVAGKNRLTRLDRCAVPSDATKLTAFIDVHKELLYYSVCAWNERFGGSVIDYGTWPEQSRKHFSLANASATLTDRFPSLPDDAIVFAALKELFTHVLGREYRRDGDSTPMRIEKCLVDSGWKPDPVFQAARQSAFAASILPSKGYAITASARPMAEWIKRPNEEKGTNWRVGPGTGGGRGRAALFDPNYWKTFTAERLLTPPAAPGCLQIFGVDSQEHTLYAEHISATWTLTLPLVKPTAATSMMTTSRFLTKRITRVFSNLSVSCPLVAENSKKGRMNSAPITSPAIAGGSQLTLSW